MKQVDTKWINVFKPDLDFQVGSEDRNDVTFTGQRIRWTRDPQTGQYIEVSQEKAIEELAGGDPSGTKHEG